MNIVFIGTGKYGWYCLRSLLEKGMNVKGMFTLDEKLAPLKSTYTSYADLAQRYKVPLIRVQDINREEVVKQVADMGPELIIVSSWSQIIKEQILQIPPMGCIGIHFALLPSNRGGAPLNWALIKGETEWGISLIYLDKGIDTGDIIAQKRFTIIDRDNINTVYDKASVLSIQLLNENLPLIEQGIAPRLTQNGEKATYNPARKPSDGLIDWNRSARELCNWIRALTHPYPGAFSFLKHHKIIIWGSNLIGEDGLYGAPGEIIDIRRGEGIVVSGSRGRLLITRVEPDDNAEMWADDFAQDYDIGIGTVFSASEEG